MPTLASDQRRTLETTVVKARDLAERGARDALTALAVGASEPFASMSEKERRLRNRLRAHGRQLGDQRNSQKATQSIERLVQEMAFEHWHRMLFARFLAENQLLIEPTSGVAITLDECEELATEEENDLWGLAAQFAQDMLPEIFRTDDPVLALRLPLEIRQQLQALVAGLDAEVFTASDSLGWTYQFWQTKRKKEVNDSGVKIGADELSPVTQLFTEDYMVDFLLDNTLGAWHAGKILAANPEQASTAQNEDDLRQAVALPGCPWSYLRFVKSDDGTWAPAAGTFEGWPRTAAELKCLDPCMGSGHFVVAMFERMVALRLAEGGVDEIEATAAVIQDNLYGLEIDSRCTQIAAFGLAIASWRRVGYRKLPAMNLACSGLAPNADEAEWVSLAGGNERIANGIRRLHRLFGQAALLGSLIDPHAAGGSLLEAEFEEINPLLEKALGLNAKDDMQWEMAVTAFGLAKAASILAGKYTLVATNVPFLGGYKQCETLASHLTTFFREAGGNLANAFIIRIGSLIQTDGTIALVTPQDWMLLGRYEKLRKAFLPSFRARTLAFLGARAFETIDGEVVTAGLSVWNKSFGQISNNQGSALLAIDAQAPAKPYAKALVLASGLVLQRRQDEWLKNPNTRITVETVSSSVYLSSYAKPWQGIKTSDDDRFVSCFWELPRLENGWEFYFRSLGEDAFSGREHILLWEDGDGQLRKLNASQDRDRMRDQQGAPAWGQPGIAINTAGKTISGPYTGEKFASEVVVLTVKGDNLLPVYAFTRSDTFAAAVRKLDKRVAITTSTFSQVPFDLEHWQCVASKEFPKGMPSPFTANPTQWLFDGRPGSSCHSLQIAVARLVGYQWPRQIGCRFSGCPSLDPDGLEALADNDGIVCASPARGEAAAVDRLRGLLAASFGDEWSNAKERELLLETAVANDARKAAADLGDWLRQNFFAEHCKLFQSRPFVWQIWDGNPHGFSALVNYHKLAAPNGQGRKTLELLTYTYLGDWIDRQKLDQAEGVNGADDRLAAALDLQGQLKKILEGEPPYDIFVRWKPLHQQAMGWDPDINDGVRLNFRPFLSAQLRKGGKAGAGILRAKPGTIKWAKDRGKEPMRSKDDFPWFWGWEEANPAVATDFGAPIPGAPSAGDSFDGNRWNDLHYSRAAKEAARARHAGGNS